MITYLEWLSIICITVAAAIFFGILIYVVCFTVSDWKKGKPSGEKREARGDFMP